MNTRNICVTALAAATLTLATPAATQAATLERIDRRAFDGAPVATASGWTMAGATAGELGGHLTLSVQAADGTIPAQGQCEKADVEAVLTIAPAESFTIATAGELCSHFTDGTPTLDASFGGRQVEYAGTHRRARVSDGSIAFTRNWLGAQGSVGMSVRW